MNDEEGMRHQIDHAVGLYDSLETSRVSEHSLASAYHILATSFMTTVSTDTRSFQRIIETNGMVNLMPHPFFIVQTALLKLHMRYKK